MTKEKQNGSQSQKNDLRMSAERPLVYEAGAVASLPPCGSGFPGHIKIVPPGLARPSWLHPGFGRMPVGKKESSLSIASLRRYGIDDIGNVLLAGLDFVLPVAKECLASMESGDLWPDDMDQDSPETQDDLRRRIAFGEKLQAVLSRAEYDAGTLGWNLFRYPAKLAAPVIFDTPISVAALGRDAIDSLVCFAFEQGDRQWRLGNCHGQRVADCLAKEAKACADQADAAIREAVAQAERDSRDDEEPER